MGETVLRQAILHALVAAAFVEAVLMAWRIRRAELRLRFWLLVLAVPFLLVPAFVFAAPFRLDEHFAARFALFSTARWNALHVGGFGLADIGFTVLALAGTALLLRDLVPFVTDAWRERRRSSWRLVTPPNELDHLVRLQSAALSTASPAVELLETSAPLLFVRGVRRTTLVASTGLLHELSGEQLRAAVAHELAHVRFRDPLLGWALMAARIAMFWNPAVQLVARAIVQETEHRADAVAVQAAGVEAFESAFRCLSARGASAEAGAGIGSSLRAFRTRMHHEHVNARAAAWASADSGPQSMSGGLVVVGVTLAALLFFVV